MNALNAMKAMNTINTMNNTPPDATEPIDATNVLEPPDITNANLENITQQPVTAKPIKKINPEQINKISQLAIKKNVLSPTYNLESVLNKIKHIGNLIQIIRIERKGIIRGEDIWNLLKNIVNSSSVNKDLILELESYELNIEITKHIVERMSLCPDTHNQIYPDYYINNLVTMMTSIDPTNLNLVNMTHIMFDIGQLEYLVNKYIRKPMMPCFIPKVYDANTFTLLINMILDTGKLFKTIYPSQTDNNIYYPQLLIKQIQQIFLSFSDEIIIFKTKYVLSMDNVKLFFEIVMGDDLYNEELYNVNPTDTFNERVYKVIYGYLRDDMDLTDDYLLNISYSTLYLMLDLLNGENNLIPLDKLIEMSFYFGCLITSVQTQELNSSTLVQILKSVDPNSLSMLLAPDNYLTTTDEIPNLMIWTLLDKLESKITNQEWKISNFQLPSNDSNIKFVPVELTQLFCLIKPKQITNIDMLKNKLQETNNNITTAPEELFSQLNKTIVLDSLPKITSLVTPANDLKILGITEQDEFDKADDLNDNAQTGGKIYKNYKIMNNNKTI